ncbi:MAG TPA: polynucleotide adenylyltransferase PcnB [Gammaproteobacteria bacterium]|nr:polynucleotide adenylyltransferase PcnB [Xanthomonadales bacterium]MCB1595444.1 polynucleotide adenylyltransferase PcnB [Xanthomonadales bacterium]HOP21746.1 polynucleotide adenylyltransferase PcnB [Gammaproteobacteria bacterium]HPI95067.1 polynucleotide adenylyltransferase PcnB [Gammaproteobacteria bacterium]HPQ86993.1 polynucleotide adenylyltransferase PcnB [Gammaproteobacteria bacterium]
MTKIKLQTYNIAQHGISVEEISPSARVIITQLLDEGFEAYIVGGAVRDLLLGMHPKDFDIVTNATPEQIKHVFKKDCRIIGRRFKLAHVYHNRELFEVATYRGKAENVKHKAVKGHIISDNVYGNIEEDATRRDFSCNALYFDIENGNILDYCGGVEDIQKSKLRFIGDNDSIRIIEDPVRLIRAIRFQAKLGLQMTEEMQQAFLKEYKTISNVSLIRLFDELVKLFHCGNAVDAYRLLNQFKIFPYIFPHASDAITYNDNNMQFIQNALKSTDARIKHGKSVTPIFLFACFLWPLLELKAEHIQKKSNYEKYTIATNEIFEMCRHKITIPKIIQIGIRNIWMLQLRFDVIRGKKVFATLENPRFRAAYDFLLLRKGESKHIQKLCDWWTHIQTLSKTKQRELILPKRRQKKR